MVPFFFVASGEQEGQADGAMADGVSANSLLCSFSTSWPDGLNKPPLSYSGDGVQILKGLQFQNAGIRAALRSVA